MDDPPLARILYWFEALSVPDQTPHQLFHPQIAYSYSVSIQPRPAAPLAGDHIHPSSVAARLDTVWLGDNADGTLALGVNLTRHGEHTLQVAHKEQQRGALLIEERAS